MSSMSNRFSYASSPDSELELRPGSRLYDDDDYSMYPSVPLHPGSHHQDRAPVRGRRLIRSSSDPSIATGENVPGIPPYPAPPMYHQRSPREPRAVSTAVRTPPIVQLYLIYQPVHFNNDVLPFLILRVV